MSLLLSSKNDYAMSSLILLLSSIFTFTEVDVAMVASSLVSQYPKESNKTPSPGLPGNTSTYIEENCTLATTSDSFLNVSSTTLSYKYFSKEELTKAKHGWGGNCTDAHWQNCSGLRDWTRSYKNPKNKNEVITYTIDCDCGPFVCLRNGWSVTRCNLLCMSRCNREFLNKYDKYVRYNGKCKDEDLEYPQDYIFKARNTSFHIKANSLPI